MPIDAAYATARRWLLILLPSALALGALVLLLHAWDRSNELVLHTHDAGGMTRLQTENIARELKSIGGDLLFLAEEQTVQAYLREPVESRRRQAAEQFRLFCGRKGIYDQVRLLDERGVERIRINDNGGDPSIVPDRDLQEKASRYYFERAFCLPRGQIYVSPFDLNVERGAIEMPLKPVIRFAMPVFDGGGRKRGIVVLNYLGARILQHVDELARGFDGTVTLVNSDGYWLHGPDSADDWGFMYGRPPTFACAHPDAWAYMAASARGAIMLAEGLFVFDTCAESSIKVLTWIPAVRLHQRSNLALKQLLVVYGVVVALLAAFAWYLARAALARRRDQQRIEDSEARLRAMSLRLITAQEEERHSISRDLHDDLGQLVTAISLQLERALGLQDEARRQAAIQRALDSTTSVLERVHEISQRLRPRILDELGLKDAIQSYLSEYHAHTGIETRAQLDVDATAIPTAVSEALYRILQEAMTNVLKHSRATRATVALLGTPHTATLTVEDDGVGLPRDVGTRESLGLLDMRERAELLGGSFDIASEPGKGTCVRVSVPITRALEQVQ